MVVWIGRYLVVMFAVGIIFLFAFLLVEQGDPEIGEHVPHVDWLPKEATDVSYYRDLRWRAWEFNISEGGFVAWANENRWPVREVVNGDLWITLYTKSLRNRQLPSAGDAPDDDESHHWKNGWYCSEYNDELIVGYDRDIGRAYFLASH